MPNGNTVILRSLALLALIAACRSPDTPAGPSSQDADALSARTADYQLTVLPTLWGYSEIRALNDAGAAAGFSMVEGSLEHPVIWRNGAIQDLGTLGGAQGEAYDIDNQGRVVGSAQDASGVFRAFLWSDGTMAQLPSPALASGANAISPSGVIVGYWLDGAGGQHAIRWEGGQYTALPTLGGSQSEATDVAPSGDIVGWSQRPDGSRHATLWHDGAVVDLGGLGGESFARAISSSGIVVGQAQTATGMTAFAWRNGAIADVGPTDTEAGSDAYGVNASGVVVGRSLDADGLNAFVSDRGVITRLPRLAGSPYARAFAVNARGDVAGYSLVPDGIGARPVIWSRH